MHLPRESSRNQVSKKTLGRWTPHVDWLVSGSDFDRRGFEALWADVARFMVPDAARQY